MKGFFFVLLVRLFGLFALFAVASVTNFFLLPLATAQPTAQPSWLHAARLPPAEGLLISDWLSRVQIASQKLSYTGTFVVLSGGAMASSKVSHVNEGDQQIERVETLSGPPRLIFRHNDQVVTFFLDKKIVRSDKHDSAGGFPGLVGVADTRIANFYRARHDGVERVAGLEADVTTLMPKDALRFGYRVWTERTRGLMVKSQTLDASGRVLEQAAFSELQLDAPIKLGKLAQMMLDVEGYRVEKTAVVKTSAMAEGWLMREQVAGFVPLNFYRRPAGIPNGGQGTEALQWIFSDGLASLSIFIEPLQPLRSPNESNFSMGATQTLTRQVAGYWLTLIGEVPLGTLKLFADNLAYRK
jgi:sigma-E factor negative regulatory protein RseB